jgi:hypothetical protein
MSLEVNELVVLDGLTVDGPTVMFELPLIIVPVLSLPSNRFAKTGDVNVEKTIPTNATSMYFFIIYLLKF